MAPESLQSASSLTHAAAPRAGLPAFSAATRASAATPAACAPAPWPPPTADAAAADAAALALRAALDGLVAPLARAARSFVLRRSWTQFGHARLDDHARERFGRSGRWVRDLAALGEATATSPALLAALTGADGGRPLGRVAAIQIARAGLADSIDDWIQFARRESVRDLRAALARARAATEAADSGAPAASGAADSGAAAASGEDTDDDRVLFRVPVPRPVMAAFDESLELYRAVEGRDASIASFVEALIGEARAARPLDATGVVSPLLHARDQAVVEAALRRSTSAWETLPPPEPASTMESLLVGAAHSISQLDEIAMAAGDGDEPELDRQIRALIVLENDLEARLSALLAEMSTRGMLRTLMFASVGHYAEERLGLSRSRTGERVRLTRALQRLPRLAAACARGEISADAAAIIHRLIGDAPVDAFTEEAWIRHASVATVKRLRQEARAIGLYRVRIDPHRPRVDNAHGAGDPARADHAPDAGDPARADRAPDAGDPTRVDRAPGAEDHARADHAPDADDPDAVAPRPLDDRTWHASLRREAGTTMSRVLAMGWCAAGRPAAGSGDAPEPDVFQLLPAEPDVFLGLRLPGDLAIDLVAAIETARSDLESAAATPWDEPWTVADPTPAQFVARVEFIRGRRLPMWVGLLALLEDFANTWDHDAGAPDGRDDAIFVRDGWRCAAPACTSRRNLEDHHIVYRSRGGGDEHRNRVTLCRFHHQRGEHGGLMSVRGAAPLGLTWRLGRPDLAVAYRNERRIDAR